MQKCEDCPMVIPCEMCSHTIDTVRKAAEVHRGRWSDISGQACICSFCGRPQNYKQAKGWRYCPMCGAIMNKEAKDG